MNFEIFTSLLISVIMFLINAVPLLAFGAFFDRTQELVVRLFGFILGAIALSNMIYFSFKIFACLALAT